MKSLLCIAMLFCSLSTFAGKRYIIFYSDKGKAVNHYYQQPEQILSRQTLEKRKAFGIRVDYNDVPVSKEYLGLLQDHDVRIIRSSKWLNASLIETEMSVDDLQKLSPGIIKVVLLDKNVSGTKSKFNEDIQGRDEPVSAAKTSAINYGMAADQNALLGIEYLHDRGFTGTGITIAFLDAGFPGIDTCAFFASLCNSNRIKATYDFCGGSAFVYKKNSHGTYCASEIIGNTPGIFVGMAPDASVLFAITDDSTETHQDEFNYVSALEWADSLGADIISSSIGYKLFDSGQYSYTYADMNGHTAISSIGCAIAASKGLLIVTCAGNSGTICAPCDADSILCVGGARISKIYDNVSSKGPSYDGRVKPDVAALTTYTAAMGPDGVIIKGSYEGTSVATPLVAGLAICLKAAHPAATNMQIIQAIKQSGDHYSAPDGKTGYGVPNARIADSVLTMTLSVKSVNAATGLTLQTFPSPVRNILYVEDSVPLKEVMLYSMSGKLVHRQLLHATTGAIDLSALPPAAYWLRVIYPNSMGKNVKIVKQ